MKPTALLIIAGMAASCLSAAEPKQSLLEAANALGAKANYSWKTTVESPAEPTGKIEGKTEKAGASALTLSRLDDYFYGAIKGGKAAIKTDEGWKPAGEIAQNGDGAPRFVSLILQNFKLPAAEVADLAGKIKDLALADGVYSGDLGEEAKKIIMLRIPAGENTPRMTKGEGSAKFWVKEGVLTKYEFRLKGTVTANGEERDLERTFTTVISDVGSTNVNLSEDAAKQL